MALLPTTYRYWNYNPSYSHPNMPASTPTSFQNFVRPRPPANIRWPDISSGSMPHYIGNRRDIFRNPVGRNIGTYPDSRQGNYGLSPDIMMDLGLNLLTAGLPGGFGNYLQNMFQPPNQMQYRNWSSAPPRQMMLTPTDYFTSGPPLFEPSNRPRPERYMTSYQRIMQDYPYNWLLK